MWYQVAAAAVSAYGKYKSRPEKAEYEKLSPIEQGNIQRGEGMVKRHRFFQTRLHGKMVEHIESKGVKNQLEGISRADIAQASGELSYAKAKDVKGNIAATEAEAGLMLFLEYQTLSILLALSWLEVRVLLFLINMKIRYIVKALNMVLPLRRLDMRQEALFLTLQRLRHNLNLFLLALAVAPQLVKWV